MQFWKGRMLELGGGRWKSSRDTGPLKYIKSETGTYIYMLSRFHFRSGLSCPDPVLVAKWGY